MNDPLPELDEWIERGDRFAIATVVAVKKSGPRPPGAKMAVNEDGEIIGAVSGGCVEGAVIELADRVLRGEPPQLVRFGIADEQAWDVGLPCGGEIDVWVQEYRPGRFAEIARAGGRAAEVTLLEGASPGAKLPFEEDGTVSGSLGAPELDDEARRASEELLWAETSGGMDPATSIAVLTHDPKLDDAALAIALRSPARFIGAMGSRRAQEARRERLLARGFGDEELARLSAPVGLNLGAISAEETALSILAEIVASRHGREGGRLTGLRGRNHEVPA